MEIAPDDDFDADSFDKPVIGIASEMGVHDSGRHSHLRHQLLFSAAGSITCGEVIVYAWMDRRRENSEKPYGTRLRAGLAVSARLVGK